LRSGCALSIYSTVSIPILLYVVHFPPIKETRPLFVISIICFLEIYLVSPFFVLFKIIL
jgi:hypothetical protein